MVELRDVCKDYVSGGTVVHALKGVSISFGTAEFVSILGPSGCGKTTLLNILGGLDRYTSGDMRIDGRSTSGFTDKDWDTYRNHSVGFVFQGYNLIMHQSVLRNVELALTISGVSPAERTRRAEKALAQVGLSDHMHKKPAQLSGGQMQRVAIARAIVNDPEIILADEPTGALDTETSVQVMEILKQLSSERLVIMVTHNPDLAERYSTRIVRLQDGTVVSDTGVGEQCEPAAPMAAKPDKGKRRMSFLTALGLSFNNLRTKKGRTLLTAFAGSIGIIGIALILSLSNGANTYIQRVEEDTLSSYPITLESTALDMGSLMTAMGDMGEALAEDAEPSTNLTADGVTSDNVMTGMITRMTASSSSNDLASFKEFLDSTDEGAEIRALSNDIRYGYGTTLYVYGTSADNGVVQVNPSTVLESLGMRQAGGSSAASSMMQGMSPMTAGVDVWNQLVDNDALLANQYEVLAGRMPAAYNEVILIVENDGSVSDYVLYALGLKDQAELSAMMREAAEGEPLETPTVDRYAFDDFVGMEFKLVLPAQFYVPNANGTWSDARSNNQALAEVVRDGETLTVVGVVRPRANAAIEERNGSIGYTAALTDYAVTHNAQMPIVEAQEADPLVDVFTGRPFGSAQNADDAQGFSLDALGAMASLAGGLDEEAQEGLQEGLEQAKAWGLDDERIAELMGSLGASQAAADATYEGNLALLEVSSLDDPTSIAIYAKDFAGKERIMEIIDDYNVHARADGTPEKVIQYHDFVGLMMSSVRTVIDAISYILIAFVAISLVVSSIMIGIITYISVLERTKEIGILRSIGASKRDVSRVFNAETFVIGLFAGVLGIAVTLLLLVPINAVVYDLTGIVGMAQLPWQAALVLVGVSVVLTFVGGLIPARMAARRDPVAALRSE